MLKRCLGLELQERSSRAFLEPQDLILIAHEHSKNAGVPVRRLAVDRTLSFREGISMGGSTE